MSCESDFPWNCSFHAYMLDSPDAIEQNGKLTMHAAQFQRIFIDNKLTS